MARQRECRESREREERDRKKKEARIDSGKYLLPSSFHTSPLYTVPLAGLGLAVPRFPPFR